jgi:hypothetical protein
MMAPPNGLLLQFSDSRPPLTALVEINNALAAYGSRVWPLDLGGAPDDIRRLLAQPRLTESETERLKRRFRLPRSRLLELIAEAGREPHLRDGGAMETYVANHGYAYPQLYVAEAGVDYSRFDHFNVNTADDGAGVDEIGQLLSGGGVRILQRRPGFGVATLHLDCPSDQHGWIVTYDGGSPHIGNLGAARPGTKLLMQVIGPERWAMRYEDIKD